MGKASELPKIVKSASREWADAIAFAIIAATLIRWLIMEAYTIPTGSMEKSLLVGDFLFVSKFHYGTRTPATPIQIPLTHQTLPFTKLKSYSDLIQLPQYRLPGITSVKRNDVVVFNVPGKSENEGIDRPIDLKTNYIKRCVAIAGETLEIKAQQVYVNGEISETPELSQTDYYVTVTSILRPRILETYDITDISAPAENGNDFTYQMKLTQKQVDDLTGLNFVKNITKLVADEGQRESRIFPSNKDWNTDWYGPITIPAKGMTIEINEETLYTYGEVIRLYDNNKSVSIEEGKLFIDGNQMEEYTFKQNYYFMMGDNRHDSLDGRFWGFVPEDHIVGKAFFIWLSLEQNKGLFDGKIRWDRFFKMIH
ncbi:MAG: signal peptidase I [Cyclobacteriaceae bacterium]|nr:signal peptidase I [Cyclobacteriaceae bacterium]